MSVAEFWRLTPRQFRAISRRHQTSQEHRELREDYRFGVVAAATWNINGGISTEASSKPPPRGKRAARPDDFFASLADALGKQPSARTEQHPEQHIAAAHMWQRLLGGTITRTTPAST